MGANNTARKDKMNGLESLRPLFEGSGADAQLKAGGERETQWIVRCEGASSGFRLPNDRENLQFTTALACDQDCRALGTEGKNEPGAHMLEEISQPYMRWGLENIAREIVAKKAQLSVKASQLEPPQIQCMYAVVPFANRDDLIANIISGRGDGMHYSERPRQIMDGFAQSMSREALYYPVENTAVHFTHGVKDLRHAYEMSWLQAGLLPLLFVLTENRPPYQKGSDQRETRHTGIQARLALNTVTAHSNAERGLIPSFMAAARNEHEFLDRMLNTILHTPMIAYFNHDDKLQPAPKGVKLTPLDMKGYGPENISQFELAQSQFWWCFKYKLDPSGGHAFLHELRDFDSGPETVATASLIGGMLAFNNEARQTMFEVLEHKYGLPLLNDPETALRTIRRNLYAAYTRGDRTIHGSDRHLDIPFGDGRYTMLEFMRQDLLPMLEAEFRQDAAGALLEDLRFTTVTGMNNAQLWFDSFDSARAQYDFMKDVTADMNQYNQLANQPHSWAYVAISGRLPQLNKR